MKFTIVKGFFALLVLFACSTVSAQHFDVEFGYFGGVIEFESDVAGIDAAGVFESEFEFTNMDGSQVAEDPGFASNFMEGNENFVVTSGDSVFVNVNQSATLGSYLTYFDPSTGNFESTNETVTIEDNSPAGTSDLIVTETGLSGSLSQFVVTSDGSEIDSHVDYILSADAQAGVYGLLLNIESDNLSGDLTDTTSEQFWVLLNNGLSEDVFEASVQNFVAVPEPSSAAVLALICAGGLVRRRR